MQSAHRTLARLRAAVADGSLCDLARRHDLALVVLFGSAVSEPDPGDVDLAVAWIDPPRADLVAVVGDLLSLLGEAVDLLDLDRGGPVVRQRALTQGEMLLELVPGAFATRQMRAMRDFIETAPLRRQALEMMAQ